MRRRAPVEVLFGEAPQAVSGIRGDFALLDEPVSAVRVWTCREHAVVLGISRDADVEIEATECRRRGVALLRRASGGGTVAIGPGTVQYAVLLAHGSGEPPSITEAKRFSNGLVREALTETGVRVSLHADESGDLCLGDRKAGGLALRRHREATLVHGTLLAAADLALVAAVLRHPASEPAWRRGRSHADFLAALGPIDADAFASALRHSLERSRAA